MVFPTSFLVSGLIWPSCFQSCEGWPWNPAYAPPPSVVVPIPRCHNSIHTQDDKCSLVFEHSLELTKLSFQILAKRPLFTWTWDLNLEVKNCFCQAPSWKSHMKGSHDRSSSCWFAPAMWFNRSSPTKISSNEIRAGKTARFVGIPKKRTTIIPMKQDRNVQEYHISCTQPGSLYTFHLLDTRSWNPNSSIKRRKPKVLFRRIFQLVVYFLIDKIVDKQPYLQLVHTCTSPYYRLYIYSGKNRNHEKSHLSQLCQMSNKITGPFCIWSFPIPPVVFVQSEPCTNPVVARCDKARARWAVGRYWQRCNKTPPLQRFKNEARLQGLKNPVEFSRFVKQQNSTFKGLMVWFQGLISSDSKLFQTSRIPSSFHVASPLAHFVEQVPDKDRYASNKHPAQNCRCRW